jgi:hypothetical protein
MSDPAGAWRYNSPGVSLRTLVRPLPPRSPEYQLYRLESLLQAVQDLWVATLREHSGGSGTLASRGRGRRTTGGSLSSISASAAKLLKPSLLLGGAICNEAVQALRLWVPDCGGPSASLLRVRSLLLGLHDLLGCYGNPRRKAECAAASRTLATLLNRSAGAGQVELVHGCLTEAEALVRYALRTLQESRAA